MSVFKGEDSDARARLVGSIEVHRAKMAQMKRRSTFLLEHLGFSKELAIDAVDRIYRAACQGQDPLDGIEFAQKDEE